MTIARRSLLASLAVGAEPAAPARAAAHDDIVADWLDPRRQRVVPVRLRVPAGGRRAPVVILSHGLGGSRDGLAYLGRALAEAGFLAVHVQHRGTDSAVWRGQADPGFAMAAAVLDISRAADRLQDIAFVLDRLAQPLPGLAQADTSRIATAGHSYGAWTVTHMLGERLPGGGLLDSMVGLQLPDPRLRAGIALSPVPPLGMRAEDAYGRVTAPILYVTGTQDRGIIEAATPADRLIPYRASTAPGALAVLSGATHAAFAGEATAGARWDEPTYQPRTAKLAVLFLRATLLQDGPAAAILRTGGGLQAPDRLEQRGTLA